MTITQTVDIPANRRIFIDVPNEVPTGRADIVIQFPIPQETISVKKVPVFGCAKGQFRMSEDFKEPLEDFMDYM